MKFKPTPEMYRAMAQALQCPRNRMGKLDPDAMVYAKLRPFFMAAEPPHGGQDIADQVAMILQRLAGDEPQSIHDTKKKKGAA
jgi:hypothetical protein